MDQMAPKYRLFRRHRGRRIERRPEGRQPVVLHRGTNLGDGFHVEPQLACYPLARSPFWAARHIYRAIERVQLEVAAQLPRRDATAFSHRFDLLIPRAAPWPLAEQTQGTKETEEL